MIGRNLTYDFFYDRLPFVDYQGRLNPAQGYPDFQEQKVKERYKKAVNSGVVFFPKNFFERGGRL
jgi:hypothetical protein